MPDDAELIKAAAQGITEGSLASFHQIVLNIFGPSSETIGRIINEGVRRFEQRSKQMLLATGKEPNAVPLKILIPIIQNGAVEENDELQDRWAALLANTSVGSNALPAASDILRQLSPLDVHFLQLCYDHADRERLKCAQHSQPFILSTLEVTDILYRDWQDSIGPKYGVHVPPGWRGEGIVEMTTGNCLRLGLIKEKPTGFPKPDHDDAALMLTHLGFSFIELCQIPEPTPEE